MESLSLFIAWRYIATRNREKNVSLMCIVCFLGIFIGSFALALVASITNGFEKVTHEKMQGIHPQLIISASGNQLDFKAFEHLFAQEFPEISSCSPSHETQVIMEDSQTKNSQRVMAITGISPQLEDTVSSLSSKIIGSEAGKSLATIMQSNKILIGTKAAQSLNIHVGDSVTLLFAPEEQHNAKKISLDSTKVIVGGVFNTGIDEYDSGVIFAPLTLLQTLFPESGVTQIHLKLHDREQEHLVINRLKKRIPTVDVYSWKDLYPALVSALKLEKYVNFFIIALITLVASLNIISLLFMQITQKKSDIAILQVLGAHQRTIRSIFLWMGMSISLCASLTGLMASWIVSWFLEHYPFITLPDVYYVTHLPSRMEYSILISVFIVVMLMSFISTWIPARKISSIKIADVLRFDA